MRLPGWLRSLFSSAPSTPRERADGGAAPQPPRAPETDVERPPAALPDRSRPRSKTQVGNLDRDEHVVVLLEGRSEDVLWGIGQRIERGDFDIPRLPPTSMAALEMTNRASVDIAQLVELIERDPLLASDVLKISNSALYATQNPAETLQEAVMRIGLRSVRGVVFSAAMKSSIVTARGLSEYSEEVWRQAHSVARIARAIGARLGFDADHAYLIGLLHDIGKVALLGMLQRQLKSPADASPALVGRTFHTFHERAGRAMAREWKLPDDLVSVAGAHHDFRGNAEFPRAAALAWLAHQIDLRLSLEDEQGLRAVAQSEAFVVLGTPDAVRFAVIEKARAAWQAAEEALVRT
jgi:putative nucleotidyltransferase with HDIG domain